MQLANQTLYFATFIVLAGLMARFLANRDDDRAQLGLFIDAPLIGSLGYTETQNAN